MQCPLHSYMKKGRCSVCKVCRCCPPNESYKDQFQHHPWMKCYKMACVYPNRKRNFDDISPNGDNDMDSPNEQAIVEMGMWSELDASTIVIENCSSNLECLNKVFHILGGTHNLTSHFSINGYSLDVIDIQNKNRGY